MSLFDILLKKKQNKDTKTSAQPEHKVSEAKKEYDFIEKYVLANPKKLMFNYDYFCLCKKFPAAYETKKTDSGFLPSIQLPTNPVLGILNALKDAPDEVASNPINRTIYKIQIQHDSVLYIIPDFQHIKNPVIVYDNDKQNLPLAFCVTPKINQAIVEKLKTFTR